MSAGHAAPGVEVDVHPTAIVDPAARLATGVRVGPGAMIGPGVRIGAGTEIGSGVLVDQNTTIGEDCRIFHGAVLGTDPQDLKYAGEETWLRIGDRTVVREYATVNRGTSWSGETVVGDDCLLMAYVHVAHDCRLGDHVIVSNATQMAGHVVIGEWGIVSGLCAIHQFVRIGSHAFVGGHSRIPQDVAPYCRVSGNPPKLYGLNSVGLERRGFDAEARARIKAAYRLLFQSEHTVSQGLRKARTDVEQTQEVRHFLDFIESSERGVTF